MCGRPLVLLVDDGPAEPELLALACDEAGVQWGIAACGSGHEALGWLQQRLRTLQALPDLVLLDLNMPGMNGFETLQALRRDPALAGLRVMIYTTSATAEQHAACLAAGADRFLTKADQLDGLVDMVAELDRALCLGDVAASQQRAS